jgi:serine/threonine protein kinase
LFEGVSTARADLWSLGATLYYAVEGRRPYRRPTTAEMMRALADRVAAEIERRFGRLLYARVDLVGAEPAVLEVELTEPSLFLAQAPGSAARLAAAIRDRARRGPTGCATSART